MSSLVSSFYWRVRDIVSPPEEPGKRWRERANGSAALRSQALSESQLAYLRGDKAESKRLSDLGKGYGAEMERYNIQAEQATFEHFNPTRGTGSIDLHGLFVNEAIARAHSHLQACRKAGVARTTFITGRGKHSRDGIPKIKIAVLGLLNREGVKVEEGKEDWGIVVAILDEDAPVVSSSALVPFAPVGLGWKIGEMVGWAVKGTVWGLISLVAAPTPEEERPKAIESTPAAVWTNNARTLKSERAPPGAFEDIPTTDDDVDDNDWEVVAPVPTRRTNKVTQRRR